MFYYTVNGNRYFNPYLAWHEKFKSNLPIEFHCNDLEYSAIDWTREPVESFDTLMDRHAKHVRNKYERLIFFWSGGTDSQTVLNVFVRNRIRIDEIVCQANKRLPWYPTRHIDWLKEHYWDKTTKITHVDPLDWNKRSEIINNENWMLRDLGDTRNFDLGGVDHQSYNYCADNHGAYKWALLSGHEKPTLKFKNGTWWSAIEDRPMRQVIGVSNVEPFFLDPILHLKQSHLLANAMNQMSMTFQDGDDAEMLLCNQLNINSLSNKKYFDYSTACGRHPELTTGVSVAQKTKIYQYGGIQLSSDKNIMQTDLSRANPTLVEKVKVKDQMAINYLKGLYNVVQDSGFRRYLNENALKVPDRIFNLKSNFSKFYNLGH
jgi:hypothetical protein